MPKSVNKYRVFCVTDGKYEYTWGTVAPTTCPVDTSHIIDPTLTSIVDKVKKKEVKVQEEKIATGGHFSVITVKINANPNGETTHDMSFPMPITALAVEFVTKELHEGDAVSLSIGPDTAIGALTATTSQIAVSWASQNYTSGTIVIENDKLYTCILDTINNEPVTNLLHWRRGYRLSVSPTVVDIAKLGYHITLSDGGKKNDMGRVIGIDKVNNYLYMENNLIDTFEATSPTYVIMNIYPIKNYLIGAPWEYNIGVSKIGGSYIPPDTVIRVTYKNEDPSLTKEFIGRLEYLY